MQYRNLKFVDKELFRGVIVQKVSAKLIPNTSVNVRKYLRVGLLPNHKGAIDHFVKAFIHVSNGEAYDKKLIMEILQCYGGYLTSQYVFYTWVNNRKHITQQFWIFRGVEGGQVHLNWGRTQRIFDLENWGDLGSYGKWYQINDLIKPNYFDKLNDTKPYENEEDIC